METSIEESKSKIPGLWYRVRLILDNGNTKNFWLSDPNDNPRWFAESTEEQREAIVAATHRAANALFERIRDYGLFGGDAFIDKRSLRCRDMERIYGISRHPKTDRIICGPKAVKWMIWHGGHDDEPLAQTWRTT